jgi:hypothetical protein
MSAEDHRMKLLSVILSAAAISTAASSQAQADYQIIRWTSGFCQIWDQSTPHRPFTNDFKAGRKTFRTFAAATETRARLVAARQCW